MAHKKGMGSTKNGRDSNSKRLGVKAYSGQNVTAGSIIVKQPNTSFPLFLTNLFTQLIVPPVAKRSSTIA